MIKITTPETLLPPAGYCIYCGETEGGLTDEHVLSHGLAGDTLILPKASCATCQAATSKVETICLRHLWWPFRTQAGIPMRGTPPKDFSLKRMRVDKYDRENDKIEKYTKLSMEDVPVEQYPLFYQTFEFPSPGVTAGRENSKETEYHLWCKIDQSEFQRLNIGDQQGFRLGPGRPEAFCRLLAKTAHAYAIAQFGKNAFEPVLSEYIRGKAFDRLQWIGCSDHLTDSAALHRLSSTVVSINGQNYLEIDVRLFACIGAPIHRVIVGKLLTSKEPVAAALPLEVEFEGEMPFQASDILRGRAEEWEA